MATKKETAWTQVFLPANLNEYINQLVLEQKKDKRAVVQKMLIDHIECMEEWKKETPEPETEEEKQ